MTPSGRKVIMGLGVLGILAAGLWYFFYAGEDAGKKLPGTAGTMAIPVELSAIGEGPITFTRTFSGTLEAFAEFIVAPKVSGRVKRILVHISDTVRKGQVVAELDDDEYVQERKQAKADLAVAEANLSEAESALKISNREMERMKTLSDKGVKSASQLDTAKTDQLEKEAKLEVAKAQVLRAEAALEAANIRLGYTKITAEWSGEDEERIVAERFLDEGDTVSATTSLMSIVKLHPITGVFYITEKDYSKIRQNQSVTLTTDAYQGEHFQGKISRIAPVFKEKTRQARVEICVENPDFRLKPGMFIRASVVLDHVENAVIVPENALTKRGDKTGVFVVDDREKMAYFKHVDVGIKEGEKVQVKGIEADGNVVVLGQQLLKDGSTVIIPERTGDSQNLTESGEGLQ